MSVARQSVEDVAKSLASDPRTGLTAAEARARLERDGPNELVAETPIPGWRRFLAQFQDVLVILLLVATAVSAALWVYERDSALPYEALAILAIVLLNATMGYLQESRAEAAVAALRAMSADDATVIRDGERHRVAATQIVVGDVLVLEEGDTIPADGRVVESIALQAAEAALTGESLPVAKDTVVIAVDAPLGDQHNMVFSGLFTNHWLWLAVGLSLVLQVAVLYIPALQQAFGTRALSGADWVQCIAVASSVLWLQEATKVVMRAFGSERR